MGSLKELKEQVWQANMELFKNNLVVHTFGNVSGIDRKRNIIAIKPSGIPYPELTVDKMVLVDLKNQVVDSTYKPSSDTRSHLVLYKAFPNIGGIVHTHSPYATAWAQAQKPIPCLGTTHADHLPQEIPCTAELSNEQIKSDYETETANQIVKKFSKISPDEVQMVLVAGHGPFSWGKSPEQAVYHSLMLEEIAKIALFSLLINPGVKNLKRALIDKHFFRKHGKDSYYGQT